MQLYKAIKDSTKYFFLVSLFPNKLFCFDNFYWGDTGRGGKKRQFIFLSHFSSGISIKELHECAVNPNGQSETFRFMLNYNRYFWANIHQKDMSKLRHDFFSFFFFSYFSNTCSFNTCHKRFILRHHVTEKTSYNKTSS